MEQRLDKSTTKLYWVALAGSMTAIAFAATIAGLIISIYSWVK